VPSPDVPQLGALTPAGAIVTASCAFVLAWFIHWTRGGRSSSGGKGRIAVFLTVLVMLAVVLYAYMRRQWLQYLRQQSLSEMSEFIAKAQEFDDAAAGALSLVQEVELVSRGYRMLVMLYVRSGQLLITL
jgi:high-affinity Fe2+/Pb2+ permease